MSLRRAALAAIGGVAGLAASALAVVAPVDRAVAGAPSAAPPAGSSTSAAPSYVPIGTPVEGGNNAAGGTPLPGPGLYLDSLERGSTSAGTAGSSKYYTVELSKGETPWFSATMIVPPGYSNAESGEIDLKVSDLQDDPGCEWDDDTYQNTTGHTVTPLSVALHTPTVGGSNWPDDCPPNGGTFVVNVFRSGNLFPNDSMPVEVGFRIEPPVTATAELPPPAHEGGPLRPQRNGRPTQPVTAGFSFDNAPLIGSGTYHDAIVTGQTRYFRVHLRWGQRFTYLISSTHVPSVDAFSLTAQTTVFNPMRGVAPQASAVDYQTNFGGESTGAMSGSTVAPARYTNRTSDNVNVQPYAIDGDYFLALTLGFTDSDKTARIPYTLVLSVAGRAEPGPSYAASRLRLPSGSAGTAVAGSTSGGGISPWAIAVIVAAAVVALLLIGLLVRRRAGNARHSGGLTTTIGPVRPGSAVPPGAPWPPPPGPPGPPGSARGMGPPPS